MKSLRTSRHGQAQQLARALSTEADGMFAFVMSKPELTPEQIDAIARDWLKHALDVDEEQRLSARPGRGVYTRASDPLNESPVDADVELLSSLEGDAREAVANNDLFKAREWTEASLAEVGAQAAPDSLAYKRLAHALLRANAEFYRIAAARRAGNYGVQPLDPMFRVAPVPAAPTPAPQAPASARLSTVRDQYVAARKRDAKWNALTEAATLRKIAMFVEAVDDPPIDALTPDMVRDWRDALFDMEMSANTIRLHFRVVSAMLNWAHLERKMTIPNPTVRLAPKGEDATRDIYRPDDLKTLFHSPLFTKGAASRRSYRFWFPLIALHSGMRVEAIATLKRGSVRKIDGVWCFDISKDKTPAGKREVPVHPRLIDLGLLDVLKASKHAMLWPELSAGSDGVYSRPFVVWWPRYLREVGVSREGLKFHSFRHTFVSYLEAAGVDMTMVGRIVGHKITGLTAGTYGGKLITPKVKLDAFREVDFGVGLGHLLHR